MLKANKLFRIIDWSVVIYWLFRPFQIVNWGALLYWGCWLAAATCIVYLIIQVFIPFIGLMMAIQYR